MSVFPVARDRFHAVAEAYDDTPNPLLRLEERFLPGLLPILRSSDVVDAGCGTGRWFQAFEEEDVRTLTGVDMSPAMLAVAKRFRGKRTRVLHGSVEALPIPTSSVDLVLLSFVLSYCTDLAQVVRESRRVLREGGSVLISDMHPDTEAALGWKRRFRVHSGTTSMRTTRHSLVAVRETFMSVGFRLTSHLELPFGEAEERILVENGMGATLRQAEGLPAIYISRFQVSPASEVGHAIAGGAIALGPAARTSATLNFAGGRVASIGDVVLPDAQAIDGQGCLILPGLINAHDHLDFGTFPNVGRGAYRNSAEWAEDIHRSCAETIVIHSRVPKEARLYWGGLNNLLSGVTTVCHHNPPSEVFRRGDFPVRVLSNFGWAHSLEFDKNLKHRWKETAREWPFILHAAEGTDETSLQELTKLREMELIDDRAVLVHGVGLSGEDVEFLNARGAGLIVCPTSNLFLFGRSVAADAVGQIRHLAIGTDSPLTARGDLLGELKVARETFGLSAGKIYRLCTDRSAELLRLNNGEGRLTVGGVADLLLIRDRGLSPADSLLKLSPNDIEMVLIGGQVRLSSDNGLNRLSEVMRRHLSPLRVDGRLVWVDAPLGWLFERTQSALGLETFVIAGRQVSRAS